MGMQDTLRALADPTRREILNLLKKSRLSAGEIEIRSMEGIVLRAGKGREGGFPAPVRFEGGRPDPRRAGRKIHLL